MKTEKFDFKFLILKILIYGATISLFLFKWFGPGIIKAHKQRKEREIIMYGGSVSEANKAINKRNKKIMELDILEKREAMKYNNLLVYTNDTTKNIKVILQANRKYRDNYKNPHAIVNNIIRKNREIANNITNFLANKDSLGYNIFAINTFGNGEAKLMQTNTIDTAYRYKVSYFYYYSDKLKKGLADKINEEPDDDYSFITKPKKERLAELDSIQFSKVILSEEELLQNKIKQNVFVRMFAPRINPAKLGFFYFSCYNKPIDSITFSAKIQLFKSMFLKNLRDKHNGKIRRFKVTPIQLKK